jgi:nitrate/nitrite-specific signal transduction histidine kinase
MDNMQKSVIQSVLDNLPRTYPQYLKYYRKGMFQAIPSDDLDFIAAIDKLVTMLEKENEMTQAPSK